MKVFTSEQTKKIDAILLHKFFGLPILILIIGIMFFATFILGGYFQDFLNLLVNYVSEILRNNMPDNFFKDLLVNGIISGIGGIIIFLPNIIILFLFISILETSGYIYRIATIMDKSMHFMGLHGYSFVPLLMGFGCNAIAMLSTHNIENKSDKLKTILLLPFMSCTARLPLYILITGTLFNDIIAALVIICIYLFGLLISVIFGILFKKTIFKEQSEHSKINMPPYRIPQAKVVGKKISAEVLEYMKKIATVILVASIIIWWLNNYPKNEVEVHNIKNNGTEINNNVEVNRNTYLMQLGRFVEPVLRPLGFDWKMSVSLITGIAAKEAAVSTIGILYSTPGEEIYDSMRKAVHPDGTKVFTISTGLAYLVFYLIYFPCVTVFIVMKKETKSWKYPIFVALYTIITAWGVGFLVKIITSLFVS